MYALQQPPPGRAAQPPQAGPVAVDAVDVPVDDLEAAVARGVFGAPTLFMAGAMYFGQDRLDFIEEALQA